MSPELRQAGDLDLPYLPVEEAGFELDPVARFAAAREHHPWLARCSFGYVLTEYQAIRDLLVHDEHLLFGHNDIVDVMGATGTPWGNFIAGTIQVQSGATHRRLRRVLNPLFSPRQANERRALMREVIAGVLEEWTPRGAFDFEEFASYFPITVMCRMLGTSPAVIPRLRSSLELLGLAFSMDRSNLPALQEGILVLEEFVRQLVRERQAGHRLWEAPDLLDALLEAQSEGGLSAEELENLLIFLFGAGYDTSKNVLTLIMYDLLERPQDYQRCAEDPAFCRKVANESMRFHNPASATRKLNRDIILRDTRFPAHTLVMLPWSMSGRDATAASNPDIFDPERPEASRHMAFGLGKHMCLGQFIARAQIEEGLHLLTRWIRNPRLAGDVGWRPFPGVWGIRGLPIEFDVAAD